MVTYNRILGVYGAIQDSTKPGPMMAPGYCGWEPSSMHNRSKLTFGRIRQMLSDVPTENSQPTSNNRTVMGGGDA
jgi:hypothetical protein